MWAKPYIIVFPRSRGEPACMLLYAGRTNRICVIARLWTWVEKSRLTAEFCKRLWVLTMSAPPALGSWCLREAALWRLPWLIRYPLIAPRSSIAIYSSLACFPRSPPSCFLQPVSRLAHLGPFPFSIIIVETRKSPGCPC